MKLNNTTHEWETKSTRFAHGVLFLSFGHSTVIVLSSHICTHDQACVSWFALSMFRVLFLILYLYLSLTLTPAFVCLILSLLTAHYYLLNN